MKLSRLLSLAALFVAVLAVPALAVDSLPPWNDGKATQSIIEFVERVTKPGSPDFVPDTERIAAFGNSDGALQMLQSTAAGSGPRLCLYIHHTDAEREWAYDRTSSIGRLDRGLDEPKAEGWTLVDMKQDWKTISPPGAK
jgi:hypothetical protein